MGPVVAPLPYVDANGTFIRFVAYADTIEMRSNVDASTRINASGIYTFQYRYIVVPGTQAGKKGQDINWDRSGGLFEPGRVVRARR